MKIRMRTNLMGTLMKIMMTLPKNIPLSPELLGKMKMIWTTLTLKNQGQSLM